MCGEILGAALLDQQRSDQTDQINTTEGPFALVCVVRSMFQAKIIDSNGHLLPINTAGEICFRGYNVMLGYWEDKDKTDACIDASGWFYSGYVFLDMLPFN